MNLVVLFSFASLCGVLAPVVYADAVASPAKRQEVVKSAVELYDKKDNPVAIPKDIVNPFVGVSVLDDAPAGNAVSPVAPLAGHELVVKLASQIQASGTVNLGGEWILLVGQKRLKVGDGVRIDLEGQSYELFIASIAATNFTVRRGDLVYTRSVR